MKKKIIIVLLFLVCVSMVWWWQSLPPRAVTVTVPPGASARAVAQALKRSNAISSETLFLQVAALTGRLQRLKAGTYLIPPRASVFTIVRMLAGGRSQYVRLTVPEGYTCRQIADALAAAGIADAGKFLKIVEERRLEGYLFPDTYFFEPHTAEGKVADKMAQEFRRRFTPEMAARAGELKVSEKDIVILASLVEKEAVRPEERPVIARVFYNRLKKHWLLESCATVQYALGQHKEKLTLKDTRVDSPYNTYRHAGLPPGPICNPGLASLKAVLYPAQTDDMFFVAASSGAHIFSRYYQEHLRNKHKVRRRS